MATEPFDFAAMAADVRRLHDRLASRGLIEIVPGDEHKPWDEQRWQRTRAGEIDALLAEYTAGVN